MGSDVIDRWERAKYDPCNGPAGMSDLKHAGDDVASELKATRDLLNRANRYSDQIAAELEECRERIADLDNALRTYVDWHQSCAGHHVDDCPEGGNCRACRVDRLVSLVLTAPASDEAGE